MAAQHLVHQAVVLRGVVAVVCGREGPVRAGAQEITAMWGKDALSFQFHNRTNVQIKKYQRLWEQAEAHESHDEAQLLVFVNALITHAWCLTCLHVDGTMMLHIGPPKPYTLLTQSQTLPE